MMGTCQKDIGANFKKLSLAKSGTIWVTKLILKMRIEEDRLE